MLGARVKVIAGSLAEVLAFLELGLMLTAAPATAEEAGPADSVFTQNLTWLESKRGEIEAGNAALAMPAKFNALGARDEVVKLWLAQYGGRDGGSAQLAVSPPMAWHAEDVEQRPDAELVTTLVPFAQQLAGATSADTPFADMALPSDRLPPLLASCLGEMSVKAIGERDWRISTFSDKRELRGRLAQCLGAYAQLVSDHRWQLARAESCDGLGPGLSGGATATGPLKPFADQLRTVASWLDPPPPDPQPAESQPTPFPTADVLGETATLLDGLPAVLTAALPADADQQLLAHSFETWPVTQPTPADPQPDQVQPDQAQPDRVPSGGLNDAAPNRLPLDQLVSLKRLHETFQTPGKILSDAAGQALTAFDTAFAAYVGSLGGPAELGSEAHEDAWKAAVGAVENVVRLTALVSLAEDLAASDLDFVCRQLRGNVGVLNRAALIVMGENLAQAIGTYDTAVATTLKAPLPSEPWGGEIGRAFGDFFTAPSQTTSLHQFDRFFFNSFEFTCSGPEREKCSSRPAPVSQKTLAAALETRRKEEGGKVLPAALVFGYDVEFKGPISLKELRLKNLAIITTIARFRSGFTAAICDGCRLFVLAHHLRIEGLDPERPEDRSFDYPSALLEAPSSQLHVFSTDVESSGTLVRQLGHGAVSLNFSEKTGREAWLNLVPGSNVVPKRLGEYYQKAQIVLLDRFENDANDSIRRSVALALRSMPNTVHTEYALSEARVLERRSQLEETVLKNEVAWLSESHTQEEFPFVIKPDEGPAGGTTVPPLVAYALPDFARVKPNARDRFFEIEGEDDDDGATLSFAIDLTESDFRQAIQKHVLKGRYGLIRLADERPTIELVDSQLHGLIPDMVLDATMDNHAVTLTSGKIAVKDIYRGLLAALRSPQPGSIRLRAVLDKSFSVDYSLPVSLASLATLDQQLVAQERLPDFAASPWFACVANGRVTSVRAHNRDLDTLCEPGSTAYTRPFWSTDASVDLWRLIGYGGDGEVPLRRYSVTIERPEDWRLPVPRDAGFELLSLDHKQSKIEFVLLTGESEDIVKMRPLSRLQQDRDKLLIIEPSDRKCRTRVLLVAFTNPSERRENVPSCQFEFICPFEGHGPVLSQRFIDLRVREECGGQAVENDP